MAFTEFYTQAGGSNLNSGSTTADAASLTYSSDLISGWNATTGIFTVSSGDPVADGVVVGDFASVYVNGSAATGFVGRVTARTTTTITVSLTAKSGTPPTTDLLGNSRLKIGGAWKGPNAAEAFPFGFVQNTLTDAAGNTPRVNLKNNAPYNITAAMTHANTGPITFQGYATVVGDGGRVTVDGGTSGASYVLLTISGGNNSLVDLIFQNNGATGSANGVLITVAGPFVNRCVFSNLRGSGLQTDQVNTLVTECEAFACNASNTANKAGFNFEQSVAVVRCMSHDNSGSNSAGFRMGATSQFVGCIADSNGGIGFNNTASAVCLMSGCDSHNNTSDGVRFSGGGGSFAVQLENCNFVKNGGWGFNGVTSAKRGQIINCGFGSGTQANTSGTTTGLSAMTESGSVIYPADVTPWVDPANGDFRINLAQAKGAGRGAFTQTAAGYAGTVGYPDIGAAQHEEVGGSAIFLM